MAKEISLKFTLTGVKDSVKDIVAIQNAIAKIKAELGQGITTEAFSALQEELASLEAQYNSLTNTVEKSNEAIQSSNDEMASKTESSTKDAGDAVDELGKKHEDLANTTKDSSKKVKESVTAQSTHTTEAYNKAGNNIEKFAKGIVDATTGIAIVMGSSKEDADKFAKRFAETVGVAHAVKGGIEAATSGFELLKGTFPGLVAGLQKIWAVMMANPILAIIGAITAAVAAFSALSNSAEKATTSIEEQEKAIKKDTAALDELITKNKQLNEVLDALNEQRVKEKEADIEIAKIKGASVQEIQKLEQELLDINKENANLVQERFKNEEKALQDSIESLEFKVRMQELSVELAKNDIYETGLLGRTVEKSKEDIKAGVDEAEKILKGHQDNLKKANDEYENYRQRVAKANAEEYDINVNKQRTLEAKQQKERLDATKTFVRAQLEELKKINEINILKTTPGSDEEKVAKEKAYFSELEFMEKHKKALELNETDIALIKQKHMAEQSAADNKAAADSIKLDQETYAEKKRLLDEQAKAENASVSNYIALLKLKKENGQNVNQELYTAELNQLQRKFVDEHTALEKALTDKTITYETYLKEIKTLEEKYAEDKKKLDADLVKENKKQLDAQLKNTVDVMGKISQVFNQLASTVMGIWQSMNEQADYNREIQFRKLEDASEEEVDAIQKKRDDDLYNLQNHQNAMIAANQASLAQQLADENLTAEERAALKESANQRETQMKIDFENAQNQIRYEADMAEWQSKLELFNKEEELKEKAFEADKNMKIAQVVISTISGAIAAFTGMLQSIPAPYGLIAGAIAAAGVAAMGAVQVANISSQKYQRGKPPKAPDKPRMVIGAGVGQGNTPATSSPNVKDSTLYGTGGGGTGINNKPTQVVVNNGEPIRAYVLAGDVSDALSAEERLKRKVTGL